MKSNKIENLIKMSKVDFEKQNFKIFFSPRFLNFFPDVRQGGPLLEKKNFSKIFFFEILFFKIHFWHFYQIFDFVTFDEISPDFPIKNTSLRENCSLQIHP